jgi:Spy/CpxP family protein refolding chaperone
MKRIVTTAFIIALSLGAAQAQTKEGTARKEHGQHQKGHRGDKGMGKLNLSADQKTRIQAINENYRKQVTELKSQTNITVAEAKSRREALQAKHKADIQAVLTAEQKAKMETMKKDWQAKGKKGEFKRGEGIKKDSTGIGKRGDRQGMKQGRDGMQKMQQELNLNADQQAQMARLREEFKTKSQSIRNNTTLSQEQKKEQFKSLAQEHRGQIKSILTKEQLEKMEAAKAKRAAKNTK